MTREEFERGYAERSGITVQQLHELGYLSLPCHCGSDICEGWQKVTLAGALDELELGRITEAELLEARAANPHATTADERYALGKNTNSRGRAS